MAQSSVECANIALTKLGAPKITTLSDTDERAVVANLVIDPLKKSLLRSHPWNFAVKRKRLSVPTIAYTSVIQIGTISINAQAHGLSTGDWVYIWDETEAPSANGEWQVTVINVDTISLDDSDSTTDTVVGDGNLALSQPPYGYNYLAELPSDFLRLLQAYPDGVDYRLEGGSVATDEEELEIRYIYDVTDYTLMDVSFYNLLSTALAVEIAYKLSASSTLVEQLKDSFKRQMGKVRFDDATEDPAELLGADDWIQSRFYYNSGWPRNIA